MHNIEMCLYVYKQDMYSMKPLCIPFAVMFVGVPSQTYLMRGFIQCVWYVASKDRNIL